MIFFSVGICAGHRGLPITQQQEICLSQMQEFLDGMGDTIANLMHLELVVHCVDTTREATLYSPPFSLTAVAGTVFLKLAAAVPSLQQLTLEGTHSAAYLHTFGSLCPHLHHLLVHAARNHMSFSALSEIGAALPNITKVTFKRDGPLPVTNRGQRGKPEDVLELNAYMDRCIEGLSNHMDSALEALSTFLNLTSLSLDFDTHTHIDFKRDSWGSLPEGLTELLLNCDVTPFNPDLSPNQISTRWKTHGVVRGLMYDSSDGEPDMRLFLHPGLQRLSMICPFMSQDTAVVSGKCRTFFDILVACPTLLELTLTGPNTACLQCNSSSIPSIAKRLAGFDLVCSTLLFVGDTAKVATVLDLLPSLKSVQHCSFEITGSISTSFLQRVTRVFPGAMELTLKSSSSSSDLPIEGLFHPLTACSSIRKVVLEMYQNITTSSILAMCVSLPCLAEIQIGPLIVVDAPDIDAQLRKQGRHIEFRSFIDKLHRKGLLQKWTIVSRAVPSN